MSDRFADPGLCPNCRAGLAGHQRCWHCGVLLDSPAGGRLWTILNRLDAELDEMRAEARAWRSARGLAPIELVDTAGRARYAQAATCPACLAPLSGASRCPRCSVDLASEAGAALWSTLTEADAAFADLRQTFVSPAPVEGRAASAGRPPRRRLDVGSLILALGALCVIVAGFIFISVSWDSMSLALRTTTLAVTTLIFGALAVAATGRRLRGSAEALWWVFFGLLVFDLFAAGAEGMLGLGALSGPHRSLVFGIVIVLVATGVAIWTHGVLDKTIVAAQASIVLGVGCAAWGPEIAESVAWSLVASFVVTLLLATGVFFARQRWAAAFSAMIVLVLYAAAQLAVVAKVLSDPGPRRMWAEGSAYPLLILTAVLIALTVAAQPLVRPRNNVTGDLLAVVGGGLTGVNVLIGVYATVLADSDIEFVVLFSFAFAIAAIAAMIGVPDRWAAGVRAAALVTLVPPAVFVTGWAIELAETLIPAERDVWRLGLDARFDREIGLLDSAGWLPPVCFLLAAPLPVLLLLWRRRRPGMPLLPSRLRDYAIPYAVVTGVVVVTAALVMLQSPILIFVGLALAGALLLVIAAQEDEADWKYVLAAGAIAVASIVPLVSQLVTGFSWVLGAVIAGMAAVAAERFVVRALSAIASTVLLTSGALVLLDAAGVRGEVTRVVLVVIAVAVLATAQRFAALPAWRVGWEATAGVLAFFGLSLSLTDAAMWQSLVWAIAGAALVGLGLLVGDRRWAVWPGAFAFAIAYLFLLAAGEVDYLEAYTLPIAAALLAIGVGAWRRNPQWHSWVTLGPGLTVAFIPSLVLALGDIVSVRALVLGLVSLGILALGIARSWSAPFWFGLVSSGLVVLWSIWPYADALPRFVVIGVAGVVLLGIGATFESRVKNAKAAIRYLGDQR